MTLSLSTQGWASLLARQVRLAVAVKPLNPNKQTNKPLLSVETRFSLAGNHAYLAQLAEDGVHPGSPEHAGPVPSPRVGEDLEPRLASRCCIIR